jgi:protein phosphatase 1L
LNCSENERKRIERQNPNPRMPLVRFVGGTWRVGGILALSRAFGDAYMKVGGGTCCCALQALP